MANAGCCCVTTDSWPKWMANRSPGGLSRFKIWPWNLEAAQQCAISRLCRKSNRSQWGINQ